MKKRFFTALLVLTAASGCTWSNDDLVFLAALPTKAQLETKVPETATTQQPLGQRQDGLSLYGASNTYARTRKAASDFNGGLLRVLELVDHVRKQNPSARTKDSRTWGPYSDSKTPDIEARLVITRVADPLHYEWSIDLRRKTESEWFSPITGTYLPNATDDITRGMGTVRFEAQQNRERGFAGFGDDATLQWIEVRYATDADPVHVEVDFSFRREDFFGFVDEWMLKYESKQFEDQSGSLRFDLVGDFVKTGAANETLTFLSRWRTDGAGRADVTAQGGDLASSFKAGIECWNSEFQTVYGFETGDIDIDENGVKNEATGAPSSEADCALTAP